MVLRPVGAEWFEILTPREELTRVLQCLANTGAVELQTHSMTRTSEHLPDLHEGLEAFSELARRYGDWWPRPENPRVETASEPTRQLSEGLEVLRQWEAEAAPVIARLQADQQARRDLETLRLALGAGEDRLPDLAALVSSGPLLAPRLYELPLTAELKELPPAVLLQSLGVEARRFLLALGEPAQVELLDEYIARLKGRKLPLPDWLPTSPPAALEEIERRCTELTEAVEAQREELQGLSEKHGLPAALGKLQLLDWYVTNVPELPVTENFAWITGWTNDPEGNWVRSCLNAEKLDYMMRITEPPADLELPMVLRNPGWARPFEFFSSLLGTPGARDVDPSGIVALLAPIMFGYMFGDVGQGAVLLIIGWLLHKRYPFTALLIPGGISAILFGFVFGSVFASEEVIPALWLHPISEPIPVLTASLVFGVLVVTLGLALDAHQCHWRGEDMEFWGARLGLPIAYFGILYAIVFIDALGVWAAMFGTLWFVLGTALRRRPQMLPAAGNAVAEYLETVLQLLVNTISFVRIGAFALAHAGICAAVISLADGLESFLGKAAVLLLGNLLIIVLEGLVVSIQTTRLVLFEFFIRFLRASARSFKPLARPEGTEPADKRRGP